MEEQGAEYMEPNAGGNPISPNQNRGSGDASSSGMEYDGGRAPRPAPPILCITHHHRPSEELPLRRVSSPELPSRMAPLKLRGASSAHQNSAPNFRIVSAVRRLSTCRHTARVTLVADRSQHWRSSIIITLSRVDSLVAATHDGKSGSELYRPAVVIRPSAVQAARLPA